MIRGGGKATFGFSSSAEVAPGANVQLRLLGLWLSAVHPQACQLASWTMCVQAAGAVHSVS
jgi:hypothetical protein